MVKNEWGKNQKMRKLRKKKLKNKRKSERMEMTKSYLLFHKSKSSIEDLNARYCLKKA